MKVLFTFHHAERSGASLWLLNFLLERAQDGLGDVAVLPSECEMADQLHEAGVTVECLNVRQVALSRSPVTKAPGILWNRISSLRGYLRTIRRHAPDVVYINSSYQLAPLFAARLAGRPAVVHVHEGQKDSWTFGLKRFCVRRLAAGALFAASLAQDLFGGVPPRGKPWAVSPNAADPLPEGVLPSRIELRRKLDLPADAPVALFLGSLIRRKGVHDLLEAWEGVRERHPGALLVLAGKEDPQDSHPRIAEFLRSGQEGVCFAGFQRNVQDWLLAADLFVLPSYGEAMPLSIIEAMMWGTPVVAREAGDVPWLLAEGRGYLCRGEGPEPVQETLLEALADESERACRCARAREFALANLTRERQRRQIEEFLHRVAGQR